MAAERTTPPRLEEVPAPAPQTAMRRPYERRAVAAFVLGITGLVIPLIPSILAVVLGHAARNDLALDHTRSGEGLAMTGIVLGWTGIALVGVALVLTAFVL